MIGTLLSQGTAAEQCGITPPVPDLFCIKGRTGVNAGFSHATNNVAELMAVIHPLMYLDDAIEHKNTPVVYVISDSTYVVHGGNGESKLKTNRALWGMITHFKTKMNLIFRHVNRMILPANEFGDTVGGNLRLHFTQIKKAIFKQTQQHHGKKRN
jgi:hypothetical protein